MLVLDHRLFFLRKITVAAGDFSYPIDNLETMVGVAMSDYLRVNLPGTSN